MSFRTCRRQNGMLDQVVRLVKWYGQRNDAFADNALTAVVSFAQSVGSSRPFSSKIFVNEQAFVEAGQWCSVNVAVFLLGKLKRIRNESVLPVSVSVENFVQRHDFAGIDEPFCVSPDEVEQQVWLVAAVHIGVDLRSETVIIC